LAATKRATVCADRDEAKRKSERGYQAGEKAARKFARRHRANVEVTIALPGSPGGKVDFLDLLLRDGADAVRATIEAAEPAPADQGEPGTAEDDGNTIYCSGGSLPQNVTDAERLLAAATRDDPIRGVYQRGGALVRIARLPVATTADGISRAAGSLQILTAGPDFLRLRLTEIAKWARFDKRQNDWVQIDAPGEVARTLAEIAGMWSNIPTLAGIVEAPTLRPDGSILERPGFDPDSSIYLDPGSTEFPPIPDHPTRQDATASLDLLLEIIAGFPFVDEASRSVALAMLITPLVRYAVRAAPLIGISAPKMSSGKTLLAHLAAYIATGRSPALMAQADDQNEERKRLLALLLEGSAVTVLDNCDRPLKSDALCTAITETSIRDRILGSTRTISVPTATTWIATGNSLHIEGDLSSRTLLCTLDPKCERPEERTFAVDLHTDVPRRRGELVSAALTIIRAFLAAGAPRQNIPTFGRFEAWSRFVREPLVWLGRADPCLSRRALEARDPVRERLGNLLEAWHDAFGDIEQTVNAAIQHASQHEGLRNALEQIGEDRGKLNARKIGRFLSKYEGRIERGYRADQAGTRTNAVLWSVSLIPQTHQINQNSPGNSRPETRRNPSESDGSVSFVSFFPDPMRENCQSEVDSGDGVDNDTLVRGHSGNSPNSHNSSAIGTCACCQEPIEPDAGYSATGSGDLLHNACVGLWTR
jgi:hypothetical protein